MTAPVVHAPNGGMSGSPLCEAKRGDVATDERDVTCGDCLDALETLSESEALRVRMMHNNNFRFRDRP